MIMCANYGYNPDPNLVSFSCRLSAPLRKLPESERRESLVVDAVGNVSASLQAANLISLLNDFADAIPGFKQRVGGDYARGHKEATGGIIPKVSENSCSRAICSLLQG